MQRIALGRKSIGGMANGYWLRRALLGLLLGAGLTAASDGRAEDLLTPSLLHPLATWTGGTGGGTGILPPANLANLVDGNTGTTWRASDFSTFQPTPTLSSPVPFIVTRVEVVASTGGLPDRGAGTIEVMPVGTSDFVSTGVAVPATLSAGQLWSSNMPSAFQVPLSAIRHNGGHWVEMNELRFYGKKVDRYLDVTKLGTTRTNPGAESPAGSLTNGVLEDDTSGYNTGGGNPHIIVTDFGAGQRQRVVYVSMNPNQYWKMPVRAVGTSGDYVLATVRASNLSGDTTGSWAGGTGGQDAPGHSWVTCAVNGGQPLVMGSAGIGINNYWGEASEFVVLAIQPAAGTAFNVR